MPVRPPCPGTRPVISHAATGVAMLVTATALLLATPGAALADPVDEHTGPLAHALVLAGQGAALTPSPSLSKLLRSPLNPGDTVEAGDRLSLPDPQTEGRFRLGAGTAAAHKDTPPPGVPAGQARYRAEATLRANHAPTAKITGDLGVTATDHGQLVYLQNAVTEASCATPTTLTSTTTADGLWLRYADGQLRKVNLPTGAEPLTSPNVPTGRSTDGGEIVSDITIRRVTKLSDLVTQTALASRGVEAVAGWRVDVLDYRAPDGKLPTDGTDGTGGGSVPSGNASSGNASSGGNTPGDGKGAPGSTPGDGKGAHGGDPADGKGPVLADHTFVLGAALCTTAKDFTPKPDPTATTTSTPTVPVKIPAGPQANPADHPGQHPQASPGATTSTGPDTLPLALLGLALLTTTGAAVILRRRATPALARRQHATSVRRGHED
ncbi:MULTISPECIES: hypothetical protein [unclassified Crossiella]|uniref:hypothetical protein n=1 Tax=unclassified Crossiella TaxID=2620835 RepID=UPI001FFEA84E|nr:MULTISPECIES: hypothetical protein [unclassified Crossiella]MCK2241031.1 hypothetical protein [Crossiella sp. S99.2]MCK2253825.1 hypothetical protein [Crossiella sp. S99.1]